MAAFDSQFQGFWTDQSDWETALRKREESGDITAQEAQQLRTFIESGYVIIPDAVSHTLCDAIKDEIINVSDHSDNFICRTNRKSYSYATAEATSDKAFRLVDFHVNSQNAQQAMYSTKIKRFLDMLFGEPSLAFQSLTFIHGSQQGVHQDGAYVVVSEPLKFAASWIALEDVTPGSGELMYYPGSHRFPDYLFSQKHKSWNPERDGQQEGGVFIRSLKDKIAQFGLEKDIFRPKKGDALIWAADLVHGGSKITNDNTRMSLVTHYCPLAVEPNYKSFSGTFAIRELEKNCYMSSRHYDLRQLKSPGLLGRIVGKRVPAMLPPSFMGKHKISALGRRAIHKIRTS
jgi:phytanoyl-CoA hydroxylase